MTQNSREGEGSQADWEPGPRHPVLEETHSAEEETLFTDPTRAGREGDVDRRKYKQ